MWWWRRRLIIARPALVESSDNYRTAVVYHGYGRDYSSFHGNRRGNDAAVVPMAAQYG